MDFVIMDINEDIIVPLILGRPFTNTANVVTSVGRENALYEWMTRRSHLM